MPFAARIFGACAILAASAAGSAWAAPEPVSPGLTSFGAPGLLTAQDLAAIAVRPTMADAPLLLPGAASTLLSAELALDIGYGLDLSSRFSNFAAAADPILHDRTSFLALANGGRYGGITYMPSRGLQLRLGASAWNGRMDNVSFDAVAATGIPVAFDRSSVSSILAGVSWNASAWASIGVDAISSFRSNTPLAYGTASPLGQTATTNAVGVTARFDMGDNWVTTTHFSQGFTQLNLRTGMESIDSQSYAITVAKHGVFGDDAVAFSLSRPASGMIGSFGAFAGAGDLPPVILPTGRPAARETDIQVGYVTQFMNGRLALQTNAAYQMNLQGQSGASAVSVLSSAKFKF